MKVAIVDIGHGNLLSVYRVLKFVSDVYKIPLELAITSIPDEVYRSDKIIFPGVGSFSSCRTAINNIPGMENSINDALSKDNVFFLGICIGMQFMAEIGEEGGIHKGLGWVNGRVVKIKKSKGFPVPHMGWNNLEKVNDCPILDGIKDGDHVYFANSYHFLVDDSEVSFAKVEYSEPITAVIAKKNLFGIQFHPEKSQKVGMQVIKNFLSL